MNVLQFFGTNSLGSSINVQPATLNFGAYGVNYTLQVPVNVNDTFALLSTAQGMSNKTLTSSTITDATNTVTATQLGTAAGTGFDVITNGTTPSGANRVLVTSSATAAGWGTVPNAALTNSSVTINTTGPGLTGGGTISLGGTLNLVNGGVTGITYGANTRTGTITLVQGSNITITDSPAGTFTFNVPAGAGGVSSVSGGTTGLLPNAPNVGALTLGGQLIGTNGGTGINNGAFTLTLGGSLSTGGPLAITGTATNGSVLTGTGAGTASWSVPPSGVGIFKQYVATATTTQTNPGAGTFATLFNASASGTLTIPANTFLSGSSLAFTISGVYSTGATASTGTLRILLGGSTVATSQATTLVTNITNAPFIIHGLITCRTNGITGTFIGNIEGDFKTANGVAGTNILIGSSATATTTLDTTGPLTLDIQFAYSSANGAHTISAVNANVNLAI